MRRINIISLLIGLCSLATALLIPAIASPYTPLNVARVPLADQSDTAQSLATRTALQQVLVKLAGSSSVLVDDSTQALLRDSHKFVEATRFVSNPEPRLEVEFNRDKLMFWLKRNALPLMGDLRPSVLVWMIVEDPSTGERIVLNEQSTHPLLAQFIAKLDERGLKAQFPLYDLTDLSVVSDVDVWGQFVDVLYLASERYQTDYVMALKLHVNPFLEWQVDSFIKQQDSLKLQRESNVDPTHLVASVVNQYAETVAQDYALDTSLFANNAQIQAHIEVLGIDSIAVLADVMDNLMGLSIIESLSLTSQKGQKSVFLASLLGPVEQVVAMIRKRPELSVMDTYTPHKDSRATPSVPATVTASTASTAVVLPKITLARTVN